MPRKIKDCTKADLIAVALPQHGSSYTVISHQFVIDYAYQALAKAGFGIVSEEYRSTADGQIAQGIYKLQYNSDPELSMMFAWTNSYNKQVKFKCLVGAYIEKTSSVMICGDIGSWTRKHMGTADVETKATIDDHIANAHMYYNQLLADKAQMETINLDKRKQAQLLGILFAEYGILTTEQASIVRSQMDKPTHVYANSNSLWAFYNYVTIALQQSHPKTWIEDQRILHYFISTVNNFQKVPAPTPVLNEPAEEVDPNQTNLLDQIAEVTENEPILEAKLPVEPADYDFTQTVDYSKAIHPVLESDAFIGYEEDAELMMEAYQEDVDNGEYPGAELENVKYTDPAGNTFELPMLKESEVAPERVKFAIDDTIETPSLEPTPEEHEIFEEEEKVSIDTIMLNKDTQMHVLVETKGSDFDIDDFTTLEEDEEEGDNAPDFF